MKEQIVILGCGGHAKSVVDTVEATGIFEIAGFVDHTYDEKFEYRGYRMLGCDDDLQKIYSAGIRNACVGIGFLGKGRVRNQLYAQLKQIGFLLPAIIDSTAVVAGDVEIGEGAFVGKNAMINADAEIGKMTIINTGAIIEHDCRIDDFCHVSVGSVVCGAVHMGENTFVGANATVIQGIEIGEGALIGAGTVVSKNVKDNMVIVSKRDALMLHQKR